MREQLGVAASHQTPTRSDRDRWHKLATGPTRWGKDPVAAGVLQAEVAAQRRLLRRGVARRQIPVAELSRQLSLAEERLRLLEQMPVRATHLAETSPVALADGVWTVWTVQSWLYYSLVPKLAAIGIIQVPYTGQGLLAGEVMSAQLEQDVVTAASALCRTGFGIGPVDPATGESLLKVHTPSGYTRRFLCPDADVESDRRAVKRPHLERVP